jgi:hypothetical protein
LIELSTQHNFEYWIEQGIRDLRATDTVLAIPFFLTLKADALHLANRTSEALEAINEGQALAERFEQRRYLSDLHRFSGVFLAALGADEAHIEASAEPSESLGSRSRFP